MTPKQKADELFRKYKSHTITDFSSIDFRQAQRCALICVDEIMLQKPGKPYDCTSTTGYWTEVKREIEQL